MTLVKGDLHDMLDDVFEIDSYASKMGDDKDIVTLSFSLRTKEAAEDLNSFIEKGYANVLDADVTAGEQSDGSYKVFVELERNKHIVDNIMEILDGAKKISDVNKFRFRYYKNFRSKPATEDNLNSIIPTDPEQYGLVKQETTMENYKNFFNRSFVEEVDMLDDIVKIKKAYADPLFFKFIDIDNKDNVLNNLQESFNMQDFAEILFLTKYIGDYNISKYGDKLIFENKDKALVLKRI